VTTVRAVPPPPHPATGTVAELRRLLQGLHAEGIPYCHWKSNEHLRASLVGKTDLDLLVHREAAQPLARILSETSFKRFHTVPHVAYPGIESYFGLDPQSGALLHLHVHYQLTLGEKHLKGYRLPWENVVLGTRVFDEDAAIYVADPNIEVLLLLVRAALKLRLRDRLSSLLGRAYFRGNVLRELCWLAARVYPDRLLEHARSLVGERAARQAVELVVGPPPSVRRNTACTAPSRRGGGAGSGRPPGCGSGCASARRTLQRPRSGWCPKGGCWSRSSASTARGNPRSSRRSRLGSRRWWMWSRSIWGVARGRRR